MNIIRNGVSYPLAEVEMETIFRAQREKYWVEDFNLYIEAYKETEELTQEQWEQVQDIAINHFEKDTIMKNIFLALMTIVLISGCATWGGIKKDAKDGAEWTKEKINHGAEYVKETTHLELASIRGLTDAQRRMVGINMTGGKSNALEICTTVFKAPTALELLDMYRAEKGTQPKV